MYLGFTTKKITAIILLLACIFLSLALSNIPFLVSDHKVSIYMEGLKEGVDGEDVEEEEDADEPVATVAPVQTTAPATAAPVTYVAPPMPVAQAPPVYVAPPVPVATIKPKLICVAPSLNLKNPNDFNNQLKIFTNCVNQK